MQTLQSQYSRFDVVKPFLRVVRSPRSFYGRFFTRVRVLVAILSGIALAVPRVKASDTTIYSNYGNDLGTFGFLYQYSGSTRSPLFADDIYFTPAAANHTVDSIQFTLANMSNASTVTIIPTVEIFAFNATGTPGLLLSAVTLPATAVAPGADVVFTASGQNFFTVPVTAKVWAGIYLTYTADSNGSGGFGQRVANPPTVGSSQDIYFVSNGAAVPGSNPSGGTLSGDAGFNGATNARWAFATPEIVPEPSSLILAITGSMGLIYHVCRRTKAT